MKNCILFSYFVLSSLSGFAQSKSQLSGYVYAPDGLLFENVQLEVFNSDSTLFASVPVEASGKYALDLDINTNYIFNVYSNAQLLNAATIKLINTGNTTFDFVVSLPESNNNAKKSIMSSPNNITGKELERIPSNAAAAALVNRPGFYTKKEASGMSIGSGGVTYMIDGMSVNGNSSKLQLPKGSVENIQIIR